MNKDVRFQVCLDRLFLSEDSQYKKRIRVTHDTGGTTILGISEKSHSLAVYRMLEIYKTDRQKCIEIAGEIYEKEYWNPMKKMVEQHYPRRASLVFAPPFDYILFDCAVNQGVGRAKRFYELSKKDWKVFLSLRRKHYQSLAEKNPAKYEKYLQGWLNRLDAVQKYAEQDSGEKTKKEANATPKKESEKKYREVIVFPGENLSVIAEKNKTTVKKILAINPQIINPDLIHSGDMIKVPLYSRSTTS